MQIGVVGSYILNRNRFILKQSKVDAKSRLTGISQNFHYNNSISFASFDPNVIKNMRDMPCLCCGMKMVPYKEFARVCTPEALSGSSRRALKVLLQYKYHMHKVEKACLKKIRTAAKSSPFRTLQELLNDLRPDALKKLQAEQLDVLSEIDNIGIRDLPDSLSVRLTEFLAPYRISVLDESASVPFKRKSFIKRLTGFTAQITQKDVREQIISVANRLNTSRNSVNAFVVKYSRRSSTEIGQRLVYPSVKTKEHFVAQHSIDGLHGTNDVGNIGYTCQRCNGEEKGNTTLAKWAADHPKMCRRNAQAYFDFLIDKISQGRIPLEYIYKLYRQAQTLIEGSGGKIKIDISFRRLAKNYA